MCNRPAINQPLFNGQQKQILRVSPPPKGNFAVLTLKLLHTSCRQTNGVYSSGRLAFLSRLVQLAPASAWPGGDCSTFHFASLDEIRVLIRLIIVVAFGMFWADCSPI